MSRAHPRRSTLTNQPGALESQSARDQCQSAAMTPPVNLNFSYLSRFSRHLVDFIARRLAVRIVVSAIAVFRQSFV